MCVFFFISVRVLMIWLVFVCLKSASMCQLFSLINSNIDRSTCIVCDMRKWDKTTVHTEHT